MTVTVMLIALSFSFQALGSDPNWLGKTFIGKDTYTGQVCVVKTDSKINFNLFGDTVGVQVTVGSFEPVTYLLTNIPLIKGNSFGKHYYSRRDTYWAEIEVNPEGNSLNFDFSHMLTKHGNSIIEYPGKGELIKCECEPEPHAD